MESDKKQVVLVMDDGKEADDEKIVCEVCGHVNDKNTLICAMCSNYLRG